MSLPEWQHIGGFVAGSRRRVHGASNGDPSRFKSLIEKLPLSVTILTEDGVVLFSNPETSHLTGYGRKSIEGRAFWLEAVHPEDAWKLTEGLRKAQRGEPSVVVFRFLTHSRGPRLAEMHLYKGADDVLLLQRDVIECVTFDVTERSEVEEALYQSEALYRIFLEQSPIGMLHLDATGTVTFENHQFRMIVGEDPADAWIGRSIFSIEGLHDRVRRQVRSLLESGEPLKGDVIPYRRSPSRVQQLKFHGSPIDHPDGGIVGSVIMVEDRTDEVRRREELELRGRHDEAESKLRKAALSDGTEEAFLRDAARILGTCSSADRVYLLRSNAAGDCCTDRARWHRSDRTDTPPLVILQNDVETLQAIEPGESLYALREVGASATQEVLDLTGAEEAIWMPFWDDRRLGGYVVLERLWSAASGSPSYWSEGERQLLKQLIRLFETLWSWRLAGRRYRDITAAIEESLFNFTFDEDGERRYLFLTEQVEQLTGYKANSLTFQEQRDIHWADQVVYEADRRLLDVHDDALRSGHESKITYRIRQRGGAVRWVREHAKPEEDAIGDVIVSGILTDVTEQKAAEQVLTEAKQQAESANHLKTAFIATMSHEIRTPMGALNGFAELLDRELTEHAAKSRMPLPPQVLEFLEAIQENSKKLLTMVNELFDLSNLEAGSVDIRTTSISLNDVAMRSANKVAAQLAEKNVEMTVDLDDLAPDVIADSRRLEQVLDNLLSNAVKFTEEGSVCVRTGIADESRASIVVSDTGVGISEAYLRHLFEPFSQEDSRLNRQFDGSGLGLSLAKRLLDLMEGTIQVESKKNEGSVFTVTLPRADV